jgi:hypothetical protein
MSDPISTSETVVVSGTTTGFPVKKFRKKGKRKKKRRKNIHELVLKLDLLNSFK